MIKYSDKFLNQTKKLKTAKVGMEFEFYVSDLSFYKTLELLNEELDPVKVWGFRQYHSSFTPDEKNFKIEPDLSGGSSMVELVTGPLDFYDAKFYLIKIIKFIQKYGYTNDKCSIHYNISFSGDKDLNDLNILKLILNTDEDEIWRAYPTRKGNIYTKSIKKIIPYKEYDFFNIPIGTVKNNIRLPHDKYYGINFTNYTNDKNSQRLEWRYIGGKDYELNLGQLIYFMERFIINTYDSIGSSFSPEDIKKLEEFLEDNIKNYKNLSKYDNFIVEYPSVQIQVDQISNYDIVASYYTKIYDKIFNIVDSIDELKECMINYVTKTQMIEIIDCDIKAINTLSGVDLINCNVQGVFNDCFLVSSVVKNSQLSKSKLQGSDVYNTKILNSSAEASTLNNCYFVEGYMNSDMRGGVFRSGKLGPHATLDTDVKIVKDTKNFFDTKFDTEEKQMKKGDIKNYGKGDEQN